MKKIFLALIFLCSVTFGVTAGKVWRVPTGSTLPSWGSVDLNNTTSIGSNKPILSNTNPTANLVLVRGGSSSTPSSGNCGTAYGEGYTCSRTSAGQYVITFSTQFGDAPVCTCAARSGASVSTTAGLCTVSSGTTQTGATIFTWFATTGTDMPFSFICIGQKN